MVYFGVGSRSASSLVIFQDETMDHDRSIKDMLRATLKFREEGDDFSVDESNFIFK